MATLATQSTKPASQPSVHAEEYVTLDRNVIYDFQLAVQQPTDLRASSAILKLQLSNAPARMGPRKLS
jgi:hypothetical protein